MSQSEEQLRSVVVEKEFAHPPEKLWQALTESALLSQWLLENNFLPEVGRKFQFRSQAVGSWDGKIDCEILAINPLRSLAYSWQALGLESTVEFTLTPTEKGTLLQMKHLGFRGDQEAAYRGAQFGWQRFIGNLERLLEEKSR